MMNVTDIYLSNASGLGHIWVPISKKQWFYLLYKIHDSPRRLVDGQIGMVDFSNLTVKLNSNDRDIYCIDYRTRAWYQVKNFEPNDDHGYLSGLFTEDIYQWLAECEPDPEQTIYRGPTKRKIMILNVQPNRPKFKSGDIVLWHKRKCSIVEFQPHNGTYGAYWLKDIDNDDDCAATEGELKLA
jgi:hypothetical protein